jgi:hypothetical protein
MDESGSTEVGRITAYLVLDRSDWVRGVRQTELDVERLSAKNADIKIKTDSVTKAQKDINLLRTAIITLGPAIVPLAAAATAGGGALAAMGAAGILAVKGIQAEMKNGTAVGAQYAAGVNTIKGGLTALEATSARGVLAGFQSGVSSLNKELPELNVTMAHSSQILGDIAAHGVSGIVGGFNTFEPVLTKTEGLVDQLAGRFDDWANGPGGTKFASSLAEDLDHVGPALVNIATLATHLVAALNPSGVGALDYITELSGILNHIPVGVLQAGTTAYIAFKSAVAVTTGIRAASVALTEFATAETGAAAAAGGLAGGRVAKAAGGLGLLASKIAPVAALTVGAGLAADQAANATENWAQSGNHAKEVLGGLSAGLKDALTLHWNFADVGNFIDAENQFYALRSDAEDAAAGVEQLNKQFSGEAADLVQKWADEYADGISKANTAADALILKQATQTGELSKAPAAFDGYITSLQKAIDADEKWTATGSGATKTLDGTKYSLQAWQKALQAANGDEVRAEAILNGHTLALAAERAELALTQQQQTRITTAYAAAETQLKLTDQQVDLYASALGITAQQLGNGAITSDEFTKAIGAVKDELNNGNTAVQGWLVAISTWNSSGKTAADRADLLGSAMVAMNGDALGVANSMGGAAAASAQLAKDIDGASASVINLKTGAINYHTTAGRALLSDLQQMQTAAMNAAEATYQHEVSIDGAKRAAKDASNVYAAYTRGDLIDQARQLGLTDKQAETLANRYFHWPKDAKTQIAQLGGKSVQKTLGGILHDLDILVAQPWVLDVGANTSGAQHALGGLIGLMNTASTKYANLSGQVNSGVINSIIGDLANPPKGKKGHAAGGKITGPGTGTSDSILSWLSNGEFVSTADSTQRNEGALAAGNAGAKLYALPGFALAGIAGATGEAGSELTTERYARMLP